MKRPKSDSDSSYSGESSDEEIVSSETISSEEEHIVYSDTEIDYNSNIVVIFKGSMMDNQLGTKKKNHHKSKKIKTDLDKKREDTLNKIKEISLDDSKALENEILDSAFSIEEKAILFGHLQGETKDSDRLKNIKYVKRVLKLPQMVSQSTEQEDISKKILSLRRNLDEAIYGHKETKEEIINYVSGKLTNPSDYKSQILALQSPPGCGKCLARDTKVLMFDGSYKNVQDVELGDSLMGDDSTDRVVLALGSGRDTMYKVTHLLSNKTYTTNSHHIICLKNKRDGNILQIPIKEFVNFEVGVKELYEGYSNPVNFPAVELHENPHIMGTNYSITSEFLPVYVKYNSYISRIFFLSGFCKTNSIISDKTVLISFKDYGIKNDLLFLIESLGFLTDTIEMNGITIIKIINNIIFIKYPQLYNASSISEPIRIEKLPVDDYFGFEISGNKMFLIDRFVVTHNTRFIRALGKTLNIPFNQISFGGMNDPSVLIGHDFTYVGSKPGKIYDCMVKSKCTNSLIYLDECDKIGSIDSDKAIAINGILTHMLDPEQNSQFTDHYLGDITLDLSKVFFIVSFNNESNMDSVLLDRMKVIKIQESTLQEKIQIVRRFTLPDIFKNLNMNKEKFTIGDDIIKYIILNKSKQSKGMRQINQSFARLFSCINALIIIENLPENDKNEVISGLIYEKIKIKDFIKEDKYYIDLNLVDKLLTYSKNNEPYMTLYN